MLYEVQSEKSDKNDESEQDATNPGKCIKTKRETREENID